MHCSKCTAHMDHFDSDISACNSRTFPAIMLLLAAFFSLNQPARFPASSIQCMPRKAGRSFFKFAFKKKEYTTLHAASFASLVCRENNPAPISTAFSPGSFFDLLYNFLWVMVECKGVDNFLLTSMTSLTIRRESSCTKKF